MALSGPTLLDDGLDNTNRAVGNSYTTASISPTNGALVLAVISTVGNNSAGSPALSGAGLTWTEVTHVSYDTGASPTDRITVFRGTGTPSAGAVSIAGAGNHTSCQWSIFELTGQHATTPIPQSPVNTGDAGTAISVSMGAFGSANNWTVLVVGRDQGGTTTWDSLTDIGTQQTGENTVLNVAYVAGNDSTPSGTASVARDWGAIALEIAEASGGGGFQAAWARGSNVVMQ